jgi:hypothetical protein
MGDDGELSVASRFLLLIGIYAEGYHCPHGGTIRTQSAASGRQRCLAGAA